MNWFYRVSKTITSLGFFSFISFVILAYTFFVSVWIGDNSALLVAVSLDKLSFFSSFVSEVLLILLILALICLFVAFGYLHKIMTERYQVQTTIKLFSLYCSVVFLIVTFFHFNAMFDHEEEYSKNIHLAKIYTHDEHQDLREKYGSFEKFRESYEIKSDEYSKFKYELRQILFPLKLSMTLSLLLMASYFLALLSKYEYKGLSKEHFYTEWYLSESLGWIKGTRCLEDENLTVLKPEDCVKIINLEFDESKIFYTHGQYDLFCHIASEKGLYKEALSHIYNMIKSCKVTYLHYDKHKVSRCDAEYGEMPEILLIAKEMELF